jgi:hypothetical protein
MQTAPKLRGKSASKCVGAIEPMHVPARTMTRSGVGFAINIEVVAGTSRNNRALHRQSPSKPRQPVIGDLGGRPDQGACALVLDAVSMVQGEQLQSIDGVDLSAITLATGKPNGGAQATSGMTQADFFVTKVECFTQSEK